MIGAVKNRNGLSLLWYQGNADKKRVHLRLFDDGEQVTVHMKDGKYTGELELESLLNENKIRTGFFEILPKDSYLARAYLSGERQETVLEEMYVAFGDPKQIRSIKEKWTLDGVPGTRVTMRSPEPVRTDAVYFTIQGQAPQLKYPVIFFGQTEFSFFVDDVSPDQLRFHVKHSRPDIRII